MPLFPFLSVRRSFPVFSRLLSHCIFKAVELNLLLSDIYTELLSVRLMLLLYFTNNSRCIQLVPGGNVISYYSTVFMNSHLWNWIMGLLEKLFHAKMCYLPLAYAWNHLLDFSSFSLILWSLCLELAMPTFIGQLDVIHE